MVNTKLFEEKTYFSGVLKYEQKAERIGKHALTHFLVRFNISKMLFRVFGGMRYFKAHLFQQMYDILDSNNPSLQSAASRPGALIPISAMPSVMPCSLSLLMAPIGALCPGGPLRVATLPLRAPAAAAATARANRPGPGSGRPVGACLSRQSVSGAGGTTLRARGSTSH